MKINLGSGMKRIEGFVNVDDDPLVNPDYVVNLDDVNVKLPFEDNTVSEIIAHHILEHIGDGFIPLMKELYRVAEHGCILDIRVPHHQHDMWYGDPTHKRFITVAGMYQFDKNWCLKEAEKWGSASGVAVKFGMDWQMVDFSFIYDEMYRPMLEDFFKRKEEGKVTAEEDFAIQRLMREATNVAGETHLKMIAVKE